MKNFGTATKVFHILLVRSRQLTANPQIKHSYNSLSVIQQQKLKHLYNALTYNIYSMNIILMCSNRSEPVNTFRIDRSTYEHTKSLLRFTTVHKTRAFIIQ